MSTVEEDENEDTGITIKVQIQSHFHLFSW